MHFTLNNFADSEIALVEEFVLLGELFSGGGPGRGVCRLSSFFWFFFFLCLFFGRFIIIFGFILRNNINLDFFFLLGEVFFEKWSERRL